MKALKFIIAVCLLSMHAMSFAQGVTEIPLAISDIKTTSIVFPFAVKGVDRGTSEVLAEQVKGIDNILKIKAAKPSFSETNLTVVTSDGKLYGFTLSYIPNPASTLLDLREGAFSRTFQPAKFSSLSLNSLELKKLSEMVISTGEKRYSVRDENQMVSADVRGIFIKDNVIFYKLKIKNHSPIDYQADHVRFYIRDSKKSKKVALQEDELQPVSGYPENGITAVSDNSQVVVYAFEKFTLSEGKKLTIEITERTGGRNLIMEIKNKHILKARKL